MATSPTDSIAANPTSLLDTTGTAANYSKLIGQFRDALEGKSPTVEFLLPLLLNLKGKPYTIHDHFPFSPVFRHRRPRKIVLKTGRQVSKSTSLAADGVVTTVLHPFFTTLYVTPLFEQVRRFSNNYVRPFVDESPLKSLWLGPNAEQNVLQRSFNNYSKMQFSYALLDADRIRGITADKVAIDEVQDMDSAHIPIILETMSYSKYELSQYTGTPKTLDNTLEGLWQQSSQAEWFVPCFSCNHQNIPSMDYDMEKMIGPVSDDISIKRPATVCAKCSKPINPRFGRWVHRSPEKRWDFAGYHVPQIIMPIHYENADKWATLVGKRDGWESQPHVFYNEVLGESYDVGQKLVTLTELKEAACLPWPNNPIEPEGKALASINGYTKRLLAVDWGGGGEEGISLTTIAVLGLLPTGGIDVIWGKRLRTPHDHLGEAEEVLHWYKRFQCNFLAHDYTGAGTLRETFIIQAGLPIERVMPISYVRAATKAPMYHVPKTELHPRDHYRVDKTRMLLYVTMFIKLGRLRFFEWDFKDTDQPGLIHDFLALVENKVETKQASDIYTIVRAAGLSDDFAQAVNIGCAALWYPNKYPDLAGIAGMRLNAPQVHAASGNDSDTMGGYFNTP